MRQEPLQVFGDNMLNSVKFITPEIILILTVFYLIVLSIKKNTSRLSFTLAACAGGISALLSLLYLQLYFLQEPQQIFYQALDIDAVGVFFRYLSFGLFLAVSLYAHYSRQMQEYFYAEALILFAALSVGMNFLTMSANLLMLFLSLESVSLVSYLLTGMLTKDKNSNEAALKYVLFGALSSAMMLWGISWLYGIVNTNSYALLLSRLQEASVSGLSATVWQYAFVLIFVGFAFKLSLVPFHFWTPDVYQAAPFAVVTFFSVGPKAAGFAALMRFFYLYLHKTIALPFVQELQTFLVPILVVTAILSMTLGNLAALRQENIKRMLAYSAIAHAGYILTGFLAISPYGNQAVLFSLLAYALMTGGAFMVSGFIWQSFSLQNISDYRGLAWRGKTPLSLSLLLAVFLFSLVGLPPFAGFIGKWYLFAAAVEKGFLVLVLIALLNSVISFYYYARVVKEMFLQSAVNANTNTKVNNQKDGTNNEKSLQSLKSSNEQLRPDIHESKEGFSLLPQVSFPLSLKILFSGLAFFTVFLGIFFSPLFAWLQEILAL